MRVDGSAFLATVGRVMVIGLWLCGAWMVIPNTAAAQCSSGAGGISFTPCNTSRSTDIYKVDTLLVMVRNNNRYESVALTVSCGRTGQIANCHVTTSSLVIPKEGVGSTQVIVTAAATPGTG